VTLATLPDNVFVVRIVGDLLGSITAIMQRTIAVGLARSPTLVVVDLVDVTGIDSAGVCALQSSAEIAGEADEALCLVVRPRGVVEAALSAAGLTELFEVFGSVGHAVAQSV
jgi:anti-anti-sigma factor